MKPILAVMLFVESICAAAGLPGAPSELRFCLHSNPKTLDPFLASDTPSETIRYLTHGVLIRVDRQSQKLIPELATAWKVFENGRRIELQLRKDVKFSDGSPFTSADVVHTFEALMDAKLHSPVSDPFRSGPGVFQATAKGAYSVTLRFPAPLASLENLLDQVAIVSPRSPQITLGPYVVGEFRTGVQLVLKRNPFYWKKDAQGTQLPYIDQLKIDIQPNREIELMRFRKGEIDLITDLTPDLFDSLKTKGPGSAMNLGPTLDIVFFWVNQAAAPTLADYKRAWFGSTQFRRALSLTIRRDDLARIAYLGGAIPAAGPVSPSNSFWFNSALRPDPYSPDEALRWLTAAGFSLKDGVLRDSQGHRVEFSAITNASNKVHERLLALIQKDLERIGIKLNIVTLDFGSLIDRITKSLDYEACLLPLTNVALDPNEQMNVWLSNAPNHQWNPNQPKPATPWEAEIDRLMRLQASSADRAQRKKAFDQVQRIAGEQYPFVFLVHPNALAAASPAVHGLQPSVLWPRILWNIEQLSITRP